MRLVGNRLDQYNLGFIQALFVKPELDINWVPIDLLIDTGSARTMISAFDAKNLGINIKKLIKSSIPVRPLGGSKINARHLDECQFVFVINTTASNKTALVENLTDVLVLENIKKLEEDDEQPSILGMDILKNYSINCSGKQFILER